MRLFYASVAIALSACSDGHMAPPSVLDITGSFVGTIAVGTGSTQAVVQLAQNGAAISGTLTTATGRSATVVGSLSGTRLSGTFTFTDVCGGTASVTAGVGHSGTELTGNFMANDCTGSYPGTFVLDKTPGVPLRLVTGTGPLPASLTIANGRLLWSQGGDTAVQTLVLAGGPAAGLASKIGAPAGVLLQGQNVFWLDEQTGVSASGCTGSDVIRLLKKTSADGTATTVLGTGEHCAGGTADLVSDGTSVYWVTSTASPNTYVVRKTPVTGGASTTVVTTTTPIVALAIDAGSLYWMEDFFPDQTRGAILRASLSGGAPDTLASGFTSRGETFALNAAAVFYTKANFPSSDSLFAASLAGGTPVGLANLAAPPVKLVADAVDLYWIDGTAVWVLPVGGGSPVVLAPAVNTPFDLVARTSDLMWSETTGPGHGQTGAVRTIAKTGGAVSVIVAGGDGPRRLSADASWVYWTEGGPIGLIEGFGRIARALAGGGVAQTIASGVTTEAAPIVATTTDVFIADKFRIKRVAVAGGQVETVPADTAYRDGVASLATDGAYIYWVQGPFSDVYRVPIGGGAGTHLASVSGSGVSAGPGGPIRVRDGTVYWMTSFDAILAVPAGGGAVRVVASGLPFLSDFVVDGTNLYFSEQDSGNIERMPLTGGSTTMLANGLHGSYNILALDGVNLYWIDQVHVGKVSVAGGPAAFIVSGGLSSDPLFPASLVLDAGSVYWTEPPAQEIRTTQK